MKLLIGLGNPESEYKGTRHNIGKTFLDISREAWEMPAWDSNKNLNADVSKDNKRQIVLIKPNVYMNDSGLVVGKALKYFDAAIEDAILIYDELDLFAG